VLVATVVAVYTILPSRHNEVLTVAISTHRDGFEVEMKSPTMAELKAWSTGVLGSTPPWPDMDDAVSIESVGSVRILRRTVAVTKLKVGEEAVMLLALRARDVLPRKRKRTDEDLWARSWRKGRWTFVAVGPVASKESWSKALGVR
jgi:hypothetical protein